MQEMEKVFSGEVNDRWKFSTSLQTDLGKALYAFFRALVMQADRKQQDYGSGNLTRFGPQGVLIRLCDKVSRLENLIGKRQNPAHASESVLDTWSDAITYQAIGYVIQAGLWPLTNMETNCPRHVASKGPDNCAGEVGGSVGTLPASPTPGLQDLIDMTFKVCRDTAIPSQLAVMPKQLGMIYRHRRVPSTVRVLMVIPNYSDQSMEVCIVFHDIVPPQSAPLQLPNHLRVEPIFWFDDHYVADPVQ